MWYAEVRLVSVNVPMLEIPQTKVLATVVDAEVMYGNL